MADVGIDLEWHGHGVKEHAVDAATGRIVVQVDPRYFRPTEVDLLLGDSTKAREKLGWSHTQSLDDLLAEMMREDLKVMARNVPQLSSGKSFSYA